DIDGDGFDELWIHSAHFSAIVSPARGAGIEELTVFNNGRNYADVLTRRREPYHDLALAEAAAADHHAAQTDAAPSIHDIEKGVRLDRLPPVDLNERSLLVERVLAPGLEESAYVRADYAPADSRARSEFSIEVHVAGKEVELVARASRPHPLEKRIRFTEAGAVSVTYRWDPRSLSTDDGLEGAFFAPEISFAHALALEHANAATVWSYDIATVAKSERGLDETVQGRSVTPRWPLAVGEAHLAWRP